MGRTKKPRQWDEKFQNTVIILEKPHGVKESYFTSFFRAQLNNMNQYMRRGSIYNIANTDVKKK